MIKRTLFLFAGILFLAASCQKDLLVPGPEPLPQTEPGQLRLSGWVAAVGTGYRLAGATVTWYGKQNNTSDYSLLASTLTDSTGMYSLYEENLEHHSADMYIVVSRSDVGYQVCNFNRHGATELAVNGHILTRSVFVFKLINGSPVGPNDAIYDLYFQYPWGGKQHLFRPTFKGVPTAPPDIRLAYYYGLTQHVLHYTVNKTGTPQQVVDTLFTPNPFGPLINDTIWW